MRGPVDPPTRMGWMMVCPLSFTTSSRAGSLNRVPNRVPDRVPIRSFLCRPPSCTSVFCISEMGGGGYLFFSPGVSIRGDTRFFVSCERQYIFYTGLRILQRRHIVVSCTGIILIVVGVPETAVRFYTGSSKVCQRCL